MSRSLLCLVFVALQDVLDGVDQQVLLVVRQAFQGLRERADQRKLSVVCHYTFVLHAVYDALN